MWTQRIEGYKVMSNILEQIEDFLTVSTDDGEGFLGGIEHITVDLD